MEGVVWRTWIRGAVPDMSMDIETKIASLRSPARCREIFGLRTWNIQNSYCSSLFLFPRANAILSVFSSDTYQHNSLHAVLGENAETVAAKAATMITDFQDTIIDLLSQPEG
jgi:hypothetical protein